MEMIVVISKDKQEGYRLSKDAGYLPALTFIAEDMKQAQKFKDRYGWKILNEQQN